MNKLIATIAGGVALAISGAASATVINGNALQTVLDDITVGGPSSTNVHTDQHGLDEQWQISGSGGSVATMIIELGGYATGNDFGVYDIYDTSKKVELFAGSNVAGDQALLSIKADGSVYVNFTDSGVDFAGNHFGFFLDNAVGEVFYSQADKNADLDGDGDGDDHLVAYQGKDVDTVQLPGFAPGLWTANEYILAWEDLPFDHPSDKDYTDFVVMVESVVGVPEPAAIAILGAGLAGLGFVVRRRKA